jgi:hypothetical protein
MTLPWWTERDKFTTGLAKLPTRSVEIAFVRVDHGAVSAGLDPLPRCDCCHKILRSFDHPVPWAHKADTRLFSKTWTAGNWQLQRNTTETPVFPKPEASRKALGLGGPLTY